MIYVKMPSDWSVEKLGNLATKIGSGVTPRGGSKVYVLTGIPFVRSQNVHPEGLMLDDVVYISAEQHDLMKSTELMPMDVLLNITGASIGRSCVVPASFKEGNVNQHVCIIRCSKKLYANYLCAFLNSDYGQKQIFSFQAGGNREGLNYDQIRRFEIFNPPLPEQKKIAEVLGTWDTGIEVLGNLIAAKQTRKKALMQQLLTGKKRFKDFKGQKWETTTLEEIGKCVRGVSYKPDEDLRHCEDSTTVRLLRSTNIQDSRVIREDMQYVAEIKCKKSQYAKQNDILICMSNGSKALVGKTAFYNVTDNQRYTVGAFCAIYRTDKKNNAYYVNHLFNSENYKKQLRILLAGTNISNLKNSDIESLKFIVPTDKEEQQKIASVLNAAAQEIDLLQKKLECMKQQKKGLMQKLLTGKIRVKV